MVGNATIGALVNEKVYQALIVSETTDKQLYFPAVVFELETETREVKTGRVKAEYWICCAGEILSDIQGIEKLIYDQFKDFTGSLNGEFPCSMNFIEHKRKYNRDFNYWVVYSKYAVSYNI